MDETIVGQSLAKQLAFDVAVIGGGPAGCAAALAARASGAARVLLADLADGPGGALAAMGLGDWIAGDWLGPLGVDARYRTALLGIGAGLRLRLLSPRGIRYETAGAVVLATGGREQTRGNLDLPGTRPSGVLTAGAALRLLATTGGRLGRDAVIAGSGRWAQVAGRALEAAGTRVSAIVRGVARIEGWPRVSGVVLGGGARQECDLLVLATPLLPWRPIGLAEVLPVGVFIAGAAAHADLDGDAAAADGALAGRRAAEWALRDKMTR